MRKLLVLLVLCFSSSSQAHDFYFAFVEMEYNELDSRFEITLTATTHDVERSLIGKGIVQQLKWNLADTSLMGCLEREINRHFQLSFEGAEKQPVLNLEGFENELTGITRFYLSCPVTSSGFSNLTVMFDFLMDAFPEQQNKLTFIYRERKQTVSFLSSTKTATLRLY